MGLGIRAQLSCLGTLWMNRYGNSNAPTGSSHFCLAYSIRIQELFRRDGLGGKHVNLEKMRHALGSVQGPSCVL